MNDPGEVPRLRPLYVVAFESTPPAIPGTASWPVVPLVPGANVADGTAPHALDRDLVEVLPALWYCLQLPRTLMDLTDWPSAGALMLTQWLGIGHAVVLVPVDHFDLVENLVTYQPALVFCPDRLVPSLTAATAKAGFAAPPVALSSLGDESLVRHWQAVADAYGAELPDDVPTSLVRRQDLAGVSIPRRQMRRALASTGGEVHDPAELGQAALDLWFRRAQLHALVQLGPDDVGKVTLTDEQVSGQFAQARYPLTLVAPGTSPRYSRRAYDAEHVAAFGTFPQFDPGDVWSAEPPAGDEAAERSALEFVGTYRAVARDGISLTLPCVPAEAWTALHMLERHLVDAEGAKPWKVARLLGRLDAACAPLWSPHVLDALKGAASVRVVGNFPLGLLTPPGHQVPLAALMPVVQQPATPLTQTVQQTLDGAPSLDWSAGVRVLVIECIPQSDPVGALSMRAFEQTAAMLAELGSHVVVEVIAVGSVPALRAAVAARQPQVLVLSAHGHYPDDGSPSGLVVGDRLFVGAELDQVPPVVLLSACNAAVRGDGGPTVTDVLRRRGAYAVLGAQVPVHVYRNALLMGRLLVNVHEALDAGARSDNLLDVWHHVQTTNLVNDLLSSNDNLLDWAHTERAGLLPPIVEFMTGAGTDIPLARESFYGDTVARLLYVAGQSGDREKVKAWLPRSFVPEAAFYHFVGEPERVMLCPPPPMLLADKPYS